MVPVDFGPALTSAAAVVVLLLPSPLLQRAERIMTTYYATKTPDDI
jgi:hypothetical protein